MDRLVKDRRSLARNHPKKTDNEPIDDLWELPLDPFNRFFGSLYRMSCDRYDKTNDRFSRFISSFPYPLSDCRTTSRNKNKGLTAGNKSLNRLYVRNLARTIQLTEPFPVIVRAGPSEASAGSSKSFHRLAQRKSLLETAERKEWFMTGRQNPFINEK